jgi:ribokinase
MANRTITIMGIFVADLTFRTTHMPAWGETILGLGFKLGPGGKGSNQAVAAARLNGQVDFISKLGRDTFGDLAREIYRKEGIQTSFLLETDHHATGAASIVVDHVKGENAIIVFPGACSELTTTEVEQARELIAASSIFMTQLELPVPLVQYALEMAHQLGVPTILNPAPALPIPEELYALCDYMTPNETEASHLSGKRVTGPDDAELAADILLARGVRNVVITLGASGAFVKNANLTAHVPAFEAGAVLETTGAGDAFNGGLAVGLSEGMDLIEATRFGCGAAGISVTRNGTAPSMPTREEVEALLEKCVG